MSNDRPAMFTIYERPKDFPGSFVVRRWLVGTKPEPDRPLWCLADSLDRARLSIPPGLVRMNPNPSDDPAIVEVWL